MITQPFPPTCARRKIKVLLIDDHAIVRQGLAQLINQEADLTVCGQAEAAPAGFDLIGSLKPDVAVVDLTLKGGDGLELVKSIKASHPTVSVLVLSMHDESIYAERVLRAGSLGYMMKEEAAADILMGIRRVGKGEVVLSETMQGRLLHQLVNGRLQQGGSAVDTLSDRELEVFRMLGEGRSTRQIAAELHLSVRTVESYREHIKEKLSLKNATELVQQAFQWAHGSARA